MRILFKILLAFSFPAFSFAQISVNASVDKNSVEVGEKFELIFTVKNYDIKKL